MNKFLLTVTVCLVFCLELSGQSARDTSQSKSRKNSFANVFQGEPGKAALYSFVLPGAGQLYNKRWWKAPLVWAGEGFAVYNLINNINSAKDKEACYVAYVETDQAGVTCGASITSQSKAYTSRQSARSNKNLPGYL